MDAQNAVEAASTKKSAAEAKRNATEPDQSKSSLTKSPSVAKSSLPAKESKESKAASAPSDAQDDDAAGDDQSEAETIVLPGKEGHSPSKTRKVKHEDGGDGEINADPTGGRKQSAASGGKDVEKGDKTSTRDGRSLEGGSGQLGKKKRLHEKSDKQRSKDGSSGLSSAPASPPSHRRRRRLSNAPSDSDSDSASGQNKSPKPSTIAKDKTRSLDKLVPHKRKAPRAESEDEAEVRKARRQRTSGAGVEAGHQNKPGKDHKPPKPHDTFQSSRTRSTSPQLRAHRRSISTQLPSHSNGMSYKKKRIPAPLHTTDYHSDESSASGSPRIRSSKFRSLTTPATTESTISPAKMAPHKKHLDAHGQTFLARACARGEYDHAKHRLGERPEDLNVADFAGNTPLQIASINGYENIVKLLLDAGCALDCVNYDKDTPLLDAVDNGHAGVIKLLLDAGVNPRKANVSGEEPLSRVSDDLENAAEIRKLLQDARKKPGERRLTSEEHHIEMDEGRYSHGPDSPRRSPAAGSSHAAANTRRVGTVRSTKTSNHLLYMPMDDKTLRQAAGRGDEETVTRILQVRDTFDDPESMVAAARGGHDLVMQLLLALGNANPDPAPVPSMPRDLATPMLAAIGQENINVIRLLLDQNSFDPTRRFQQETYHEIARRRQGPNWKDEEHMLKEAYDAYRKSHPSKDTAKTKSPARREQDKRVGRAEAKDEPSRAAHKRKLSSPSREGKKAASSKLAASPKEKRRSSSFTLQADDQTSPKRGPGRPRKEDRVPAIAIPDREPSPAALKLAGKARRVESDPAAGSSDGEAIKPRRKLVSGRELNRERDKQRRASMVSTASSLKDPSSPRDPRHEEGVEKPKSEKYHDRTKQLKRDESKDRLSVSGESSGKRHRSSATPPLHGSEREGGEAPLKRRRLEAEVRDKKKHGASSEDRLHKSGGARDAGNKTLPKDRDDDERKTSSKATKKREASSDRSRRESGKSAASEKSIHVKSEDMDIDMPDAEQLAQEAEAAARAQKDKEEKKKLAEAEAKALELKKKEEEQKRREEEAKRKLEEEVAKRKADEERKRKEEEDRRRKEEEELEREKKRKEEEERKRKEEEERKHREEEEKLRREAEELKRKQEEEKRKLEEEERLRKEQLEREAAEAARRKREEEERKERERLQREEMERRRAAREAEQRRVREEQERIRLSKLPPLLRWLDKSVNPKSAEIAGKFGMMQGVRYDCIRPAATGTPDGREQWLLNTQVALLLGEKDLKLSRYTAWEHVPVSAIAKKIIWRLEADRYALLTPNLYDLGKQLPNYYCGEDPETMGYRVIEKLRGEAWTRFEAMDMFFVKASELMYIVPTIPHLRNLRLTVAYRELPENEAEMAKAKWATTQKWKNDPDVDRFHGFAPRNKYYVNGEMIREERPGMAEVSKTPFPERRVPRRGLTAVQPEDPDYTRLCKEQGLEYLLSAASSPRLPNGVHSPRLAHPNTNGGGPSRTPRPLVNGDASIQVVQIPVVVPVLTSAESQQPRPLLNGVNGTG